MSSHIPRVTSAVSVAEVPEFDQSKVVEVEKKIELPGGDVPLFEKLISSFGAVLQQRKKFTDTYFDTVDLLLTAANHYLRQRDGQWELKIPMRGDSFAASVFEELEDELDIALYMSEKFPSICLPFAPTTSAKVPLTKFMTFSTHRSKWTLDDIAIDIDEACYGFSLAEFEVLCSSEAEVPETLSRIDELCQKFGIDTEGAPQGLGKMEKYALINPELKAHVLRYAPDLIQRFL